MKLLGVGAVPISVWVVLVVQKLGAASPVFFDTDRWFFVHMNGKNDVERFSQKVRITGQLEHNLPGCRLLNGSFSTSM